LLNLATKTYLPTYIFRIGPKFSTSSLFKKTAL
jgi:hypothetical protein